MARGNFETCHATTDAFEGGFSNHPSDPGGATMRGVTQAVYTSYRRSKGLTVRSVRDITKVELFEIYKVRYWDRVRGDDLPFGLDLVTYDAGVNSGPSRGIRWTQQALGTTADGRIGPQTVGLVNAIKNKTALVSIIKRAARARLSFVKGLRTFAVFGRGWTRRISTVEARAVAMADREAFAETAVTEAREAESEAAKARRQGAAAGAGSAGTGAGTQAPVDAVVTPEAAPWLATAWPWLLAAVALTLAGVAVWYFWRSGYLKERAAIYRAVAVETAVDVVNASMELPTIAIEMLRARLVGIAGHDPEIDEMADPALTESDKAVAAAQLEAAD